MDLVKNWHFLLDHGTLKSGVSHKRFDEFNRFIELFLHVDSKKIIFGLTANLVCMLFNCWGSTAVVLLKNDTFPLVPIEKFLELGFPECF